MSPLKEKWVYDIKEYGIESDSPLFVSTSSGVFFTTNKDTWDILEATDGKLVASMLEVDGDLIVATEDTLIRYQGGKLEDPMFVRQDIQREWAFGITAIGGADTKQGVCSAWI